METKKLDILEKRIRQDIHQCRREKDKEAKETALWEAFLRKKNNYCKQILATRVELAKEVSRILPAYQKLLASSEWARLKGGLNYFHRKYPSVGKRRKCITLPNMNINWAVPAAFLYDERCQKDTSPEPYSPWVGSFNWQIGGRIALRHTIHRGRYMAIRHHEYDLARFTSFEDLAGPPSPLRPSDPKFASDQDTLGISNGEAEATVILCTRRLLEWIDKGKIVDMVAKEYEELLRPDI